jgi:restriction system protein
MRILGVAQANPVTRSRVSLRRAVNDNAGEVMKFKVSENSLFAVLMRSPWWVSALIAGAIFLAMRQFFADMFAVAGALPFAVICVAAGWKQLRAPSAKKVVERLAALRAMSWEEFAPLLEAGFKRDGYQVKRVPGAADFELEKDWRVSLVLARRWKASVTGVEPLKELAAAAEKRKAGECVYVCAGELSDNAKDFALHHRIRRIEGADLVNLAKK